MSKKHDILDKHGEPIKPKKDSLLHKASKVRKNLWAVVVGISSLLALTVGVISNLEKISQKFKSQEILSGRFEILDDSLNESSTKYFQSSPYRIGYVLTRTSKGDKLSPDSKILSDYFVENTIPSKYVYDYFNVKFPVVDLIVTNTTSKVVEIEEIKVEVSESIPDYRPLFIAWPNWNSGELKLFLRNEGWGHASEVDISLNLFYDPTEKPIKNVSFHFDHILQGVQINLDTTLNEIHTDSLWHIWLNGKLSYTDAYNNKVTLSIPNSKAAKSLPVGGGPTPVTGKYDFLLEVDSSSYTKSKQISHVIKPLETERLQFELAAPISSGHMLKISAHLNDETIISSSVINMSIFFPRSNYLEETEGWVDWAYFLDEDSF